MGDTVSVPPQKITPGESSSHQENVRRRSGQYDFLTVPLHPLKIKPAGNAYTATKNIKLAAGSFALLPDELLVQVLEYLGAASLKRLGSACKALYAFSRLEDLWKTLCIEYDSSIWVSVGHLVATSPSLIVEVWTWILFHSFGPFFAVQVEAMGLLVLGQCTYHQILLQNRHLHISIFLSVCCISSTLRNERILKGHILGLLLSLLCGVERGALPISTCPKPIVPKSPARTYSLMSSIGPSSALTLRLFPTRVTYRLAMLSHG